MWTKICGITTMKAAVAATESGADAIGLVFAPNSKRQITTERAQQLVQGISEPIAKVGVFVDETPEQMNAIAQYVGLTHIQMHGDEPPEYIAQVTLPVIKAFRIKGPEDLQRLADYRDASGILLDPYVPGQHGGTGQTLDWTLVRWAAEALRKAGVELSGPNEPLTKEKPKLILAGGLTPQNVDGAIRQAQPGGVDVSSGVETAGEKDVDKIYDFVDMVKGAEM